MSATRGKNCTIAVEWDAFIELAAQEVFQLMLNASLVPVAELRTPHSEITAMVGLAGQMCGVFSIECSSEAAVQITSAMLGVASGATNEETCDAVGEVCNMVAGNFKSKLEGVGDGCMLSVPTVVSGVDYAVRCLARGDSIEKLFHFKGEPIRIALEVEG